MATYTTTADANGDFTVSFGSAEYTSGEKITVTATKDAASKTIELYAPSEPVPPVSAGAIQFSGNLNSFPDNIGHVTLSGMTSIRMGAFNASPTGCIWKSATGLTLPQGLTSIGDSAFNAWTMTTALIIPNSVTTLGVSAFAGWSAALSLQLSTSLTAIQNNAFQNWTSATSLVVLNNVLTIGNGSFGSWTNALSLTIGTGVTSIGTAAFAYWGKVETITVLAVSPPGIASNTFASLNPVAIFKVPTGSVAAYQAAPNWSAFAARIQAI